MTFVTGGIVWKLIFCCFIETDLPNCSEQKREQRRPSNQEIHCKKTMPIPIVDSHIHLFPATHLDTLSWYSPSGPLVSQHSVAEYKKGTASTSTSPSTNDATYLKGFIFLETDRKSSLSPDDWVHPLDEVSFLARVATGDPIDGEGHEAPDSDLCLAIVPWAPVPAGVEALQNYLSQVRERTEPRNVWEKVKGVRYLMQDKPAGTMLGDGVVPGLKWLARQGLTFDLGVDARQGGFWQLEEAVQLLQKVHSPETDGGDPATLKVVISMYYIYSPLDYPCFFARVPNKLQTTFASPIFVSIQLQLSPPTQTISHGKPI